jgi:adenylate kinase family enzyme
MAPQRIAVVGSTGSGKTTLARRLSSILQAPHVELDALWWKPHWTTVTVEEFHAQVRSVVDQPRWVIDGNYGAIRDRIWQRADCIIWLDYSVPVIFRRLIARTWRRVFVGEECCNGNRETFWRTFSRDSILWWAVKTYHPRRREYPSLLEQQAAAGKTIVIHASPAATEAWLAEVASAHSRGSQSVGEEHRAQANASAPGANDAER